MKISIIVAIAQGTVIGKNNDLPWRLPADMKYFKDTTMGHCVIMGRKNYDSIPLKYRPLEGRTNIILTRNKDYQAPGCIVVHSMTEALEKARGTGDQEIFIGGGSEIYQLALDLADKMYITRIHHSFEGDVFFPSVNLEENWKLIEKKDCFPEGKNHYPYTFFVYERVR